MTERERLIELIEQCSCHYSPPCTGECGECYNVEMYDRNIEHIADHLLANGVIVPPVKVGDTAYYLTTVDTLTELGVAEIFAGNVFSVINDLTGIWIFCRYDSGLTYYHNESDIGKTVFLAREEAEKALEGKT